VNYARRMIRFSWFTLALACGACSADPVAPAPNGTDAGGNDVDASPFKPDASVIVDSGAADAESPAELPTGSAAAIDAWIAGGAYKSWKCETAAHAPVGNSAHGRNRICSNPTLSNHGTGAYPVGAANMKELYGSGNAITGYALMVKKTSGTAADTWFYYEKIGASVVANGLGAGGCTGCHSGAPNDNVYSQIR
jgi:hypothetical protein